MNYLSLFSGLDAATLAWAPLGWRCAGVAEIEPAPCQVLCHRLGATAPRYLPAGFYRKQYRNLTPGTRIQNLGDVSQATDADIAALGHIDIVIGGSPCQDLSVAGKRAGLAGARSGLFHEQLRIFHAARTFCGARFLLWENVPGAFSSHRGRDFARVVGDMAGLELAVPDDGWGTEGLAVGRHGLVEWCVLDAQWFGVAQRRRRVFALLDTGDWTRRRPVLLESDRLRGDSAPRREAREGTAEGAEAGLVDRGAPRTAGDRAFVRKVAGSLAVSGGRAYPGTCAQDADQGFLIAMAHGQGGAEIAQDGGAPTLTCNHEAPIVAHALRADGFDASEDGTGRGTPLVPVAFSCKDHGADAGELSPTLRAMGHGASHANAGGQVAVAFAQNQRDEVRTMDVAGALAAEPGAKQQTYAMQGMAVRRLTPRECERLQGIKDDYTLVPWGKRLMADGPRYKMLGNSFAVPVIRWIGQSLEDACNAS